MAKWFAVNGFLLTKQDADDVAWLIDLALPHVTMTTKTKRRLATIQTYIRGGGSVQRTASRSGARWKK